MSVGDTESVNFCVNEFERTCLKLRSSKFEFKFINAKIYALMCLPLMESEQEFLYQFFVRNVLPLSELNSNFTQGPYIPLTHESSRNPALRYSLGSTPYFFRNAFASALLFGNPLFNAISLIVCSVFVSS